MHASCMDSLLNHMHASTITRAYGKASIGMISLQVAKFFICHWATVSHLHHRSEHAKGRLVFIPTGFTRQLD